jgi:putative transposase
VAGVVTDLTRSRKELVAENTLLRQQLIVASRRVKRPAFRPGERGLLVVLSRLVHNWRDAVLLVKPETILRWHREGFRLFWRHKSRKPCEPRSRLFPDVIELIRRMATSNPTWGAERIRGELLKLGIRVAKRSIQRYMRSVPPSAPRGQKWHTFLQNHTVWACDFLQTHDIWFRIILNERHMKSLFEECSFRYFNSMRPHQGLAHRIPVSAPRQVCCDASRVVAIPVLGGLHHDYRAVA